MTPDKGDTARMFNLGPLIADNRRFSRIYRGHKELIDHIYATRELVDLGPAVDSHIDWATLTNTIGGMPSISANPNTRRDKPASDHAPVTATFNGL